MSEDTKDKKKDFVPRKTTNAPRPIRTLSGTYTPSYLEVKPKDPPVPISGIDVMKDLSLDATKMIMLASEDLLKPYFPDKPGYYFEKYLDPFYDSIKHLSTWIYRKSDVEKFKLTHKDYLEELRLHVETVGEKDSDQAGSADKKQTLSVSDYINQKRKDGAKDEIIAYELHDKRGKFKLTYMDIARQLGLDKGYQVNQFDAIKQRVKRVCEKGKAMLENNLI